MSCSYNTSSFASKKFGKLLISEGHWWPGHIAAVSRHIGFFHQLIGCHCRSVEARIQPNVDEGR